MKNFTLVIVLCMITSSMVWHSATAQGDEQLPLENAPTAEEVVKNVLRFDQVKKITQFDQVSNNIH